MSKIVSFGFQNKSENTKVTIKPIQMNPVTNFALKADEPTEVVLDNKTCPLDQGEVLSYKCRDIKRVSTSQDVRYPAPVTSGVQCVVKLEEILTITDSENPNFRVDEPIVIYETVMIPKSGNIDGSTIEALEARLQGALRKADGTSRWGELIRSALKPTVD